MADYQLSPLAECDLEDIWFYTFKHWSQKQADSYYNDIIVSLEKLVSGKLSGRPTDIRRGYLKCPVGSHLVFFRHLDDGVEVIRILHQSMDFDRHLS